MRVTLTIHAHKETHGKAWTTLHNALELGKHQWPLKPMKHTGFHIQKPYVFCQGKHGKTWAFDPFVEGAGRCGGCGSMMHVIGRSPSWMGELGASVLFTSVAEEHSFFGGIHSMNWGSTNGCFFLFHGLMSPNFL